MGRLVDELGGLNLDQYSNRAAFRAHSEGTMREIVEQLGHAPDILVVVVNTTGTIGGCARHIRDNGLPTRAIAVDAEGSVLFGGTRGERILPGYGAGVVTELSRETVPDEVIRVNARDAVAAALRAVNRLSARCLGRGGVRGRREARTRKRGAEIVAVFHDDGRAYLNTIYNDEWVERNVN